MKRKKLIKSIKINTNNNQISDDQNWIKYKREDTIEFWKVYANPKVLRKKWEERRNKAHHPRTVANLTTRVTLSVVLPLDALKNMVVDHFLLSDVVAHTNHFLFFIF